MIAASLETLTRKAHRQPGSRAGKRRWKRCRGGVRVYRRDIAENAEVLEYFEKATPVLNWIRLASVRALRAEPKADDLRTCAPFHGFLDGCRVAMLFPPGTGWQWDCESFAEREES